MAQTVKSVFVYDQKHNKSLETRRVTPLFIKARVSRPFQLNRYVASVKIQRLRIYAKMPKGNLTYGNANFKLHRSKGTWK